MRPNSTNFVSFLITSVLNCASDRLAISSLLSCIFSGALICSFIWAIFLSWSACYIKGRSLRYSPGRGNAGRCPVMLYVREGPRGSNGACSTLLCISIFHSDTHNQTGPLWCWFLSGWACARPRPLWVSPAISPVRLGVSPAAAPTPVGVFNQRFEALFPRAGALGCVVCFPPRHLSSLSVCNVGSRVATHCSACTALRHSECGPLSLSARMWGRRVCQWSDCLPSWSHTPPVSVPPWPCESSMPRLPVSAPPTSLDECLFFISFVSDFLAVQFSVRSGCVRRHSVVPTPPSWFSSHLNSSFLFL